MNPHYDDGDVTVYHGVCLDVLRGLPDASVDAVVTDPPYGLEFMGKEWDSFAPADMVRRSGWEHAQSGAGIARDPSTPQGRTGVSFHKRRSTYKCGRCGKRDAFKNRQQCGGSGDHDWQHEWVDKQPTGEAIPYLVDLVDSGLIRILDLAFITKDAEGNVAEMEIADLGDGDFAVFEGVSTGLIGEEDHAEAANALENGTSAAILVYENRWAAPFAAAVRNSGGQLVASGRIPIQALLASLDATEA